MPARPKAMTTIELLVAIGVVTILAAILLLGLSKVRSTGQAQDTKLALENLRSMLGEYENATRFGRNPPDTWAWANGPTVGPPNNFWTSPAPRTGGLQPDLDAPADVRADSSAQADIARSGSRAIVNTSLAMGQIASVSANRAAMSGMNQDKLFYPNWVGTSFFAGPGADHAMLTNDDITSEAVVYTKGMRVRHGGRNYICTESEPGTTPPSPGGTTPWAEDAAPAPMLKDGWGNPIIFVPATGLRVRLLMDKNALDPTLQWEQTRVVTSVGLVDPGPSTNYNTNTYRTPAGAKPFFASAGPDGNFATGDDNLYSFEN